MLCSVTRPELGRKRVGGQMVSRCAGLESSEPSARRLCTQLSRKVPVLCTYPDGMPCRVVCAQEQAAASLAWCLQLNTMWLRMAPMSACPSSPCSRAVHGYVLRHLVRHCLSSAVLCMLHPIGGALRHRHRALTPWVWRRGASSRHYAIILRFQHHLEHGGAWTWPAYATYLALVSGY